MTSKKLFIDIEFCNSPQNFLLCTGIVQVTKLSKHNNVAVDFLFSEANHLEHLVFYINIRKNFILELGQNLQPNFIDFSIASLIVIVTTYIQTSNVHSLNFNY